MEDRKGDHNLRAGKGDPDFKDEREPINDFL
jgi:hypothetical protein